jgi:hypothetical protein
MDISNPNRKAPPMGTRNLTKVIDKNGTLRVAQYGQWDGYPGGQGANMLAFISEYKMLDKIEQSLAKCRWIDQAQIDQLYFRYENLTDFEELRNGMSGLSIAYPTISRDTCTDILKVIVYSNEYVELSDESDFENDQLMCEGIFTLDYQTREFITTYHGKTVKFGFDSLPTLQEYLKSFEEELTSVQLFDTIDV